MISASQKLGFSSPLSYIAAEKSGFALPNWKVFCHPTNDKDVYSTLPKDILLAWDSPSQPLPTPNNVEPATHLLLNTLHIHEKTEKHSRCYVQRIHRIGLPALD
jgi:hypothetical protein